MTDTIYEIANSRQKYQYITYDIQQDANSRAAHICHRPPDSNLENGDNRILAFAKSIPIRCQNKLCERVIFLCNNCGLHPTPIVRDVYNNLFAFLNIMIISAD